MVQSCTRIDHSVVSKHFILLLRDVRYEPTGFSDHHAAITYINCKPTVVSRDKGQETLQTVTTPEFLIGRGVWKLYHAAAMETDFQVYCRSFAESLVGSVTKGDPCTIEMWDEIKARLRRYARERSTITGFRRKQPGKKITEIQTRLEELSVEREEDR